MMRAPLLPEIERGTPNQTCRVFLFLQNCWGEDEQMSDAYTFSAAPLTLGGTFGHLRFPCLLLPCFRWEVVKLSSLERKLLVYSLFVSFLRFLIFDSSDKKLSGLSADTSTDSTSFFCALSFFKARKEIVLSANLKEVFFSVWEDESGPEKQGKKCLI